MFSYDWSKNDYPENCGLTVFGTFICGGGSSMGYKLAGFKHLGGVEIDKEIASNYSLNHSPRYLFNEDIREFNKRTDLPEELFNLDILDGSPPCSTFSMSGDREKAWGKKKQFREGQAMQTLDDLVFVYCDTIIKLKPKVFILENVKGIIQGNAKSYSKRIVQKMEEAGYCVQVFMLNGATMGVPQKRERVFFIGYQRELKFGKLMLNFNEKPVVLGKIRDNIELKYRSKIGEGMKPYFKNTKEGNTVATAHPKGHYFNFFKLSEKQVCPTFKAGSIKELFWSNGYGFSEPEMLKLSTFPRDYIYPDKNREGGNNKLSFMVGMSVPPVMIAQIAYQIRKQWFKK